MEGVIYTIDQLGRALAHAEQQNAALRARVVELEEQIAATTNGPGDGDGSS